MFVTFDDWIRGRSVASLGTNAGSPELPFQRWRHFKEAFTPEVVYQAVTQSNIPVRRCLDPFGGSGTTALACQFLGVHPVTFEVNPYLADLIEAKLTSYDVESLIGSLAYILRAAKAFDQCTDTMLSVLPQTFVEPGIDGRWIFSGAVARRILALRYAIDQLPDLSEKRLFRVLLGGVLIGLSNVVVNGKGRRYRQGWSRRIIEPAVAETAFSEAATTAISEINRFSRRRVCEFQLLRGDAREMTAAAGQVDVSVFSPPYPNSFDYTDVYNVELWMLGYLQKAADNRQLREATLSSHVQIKREFTSAPSGSAILNNVTSALSRCRSNLWSKCIPDMIGGYFSELHDVVQGVSANLTAGGSIWIVVGDSRYAGVAVPVAEILAELAPTANLEVDRLEPLREMRVSAQQGGQHQLAENLLVLTKP